MVEVSHKTSLIILANAKLGAKNPAEAAFYAFIKPIGWLLRSPVASAILAGIARLGYYCSNFYIFPG
jgi:hypothetical protein